MGKYVKNFVPGGGILSDLWRILKGGHPGNPLIWIRDLGDESSDQADPHSIPPQGESPFWGY